jgi:hypothetical protein
MKRLILSGSFGIPPRRSVYSTYMHIDQLAAMLRTDKDSLTMLVDTGQLVTIDQLAMTWLASKNKGVPFAATLDL